MTAMLVPIFICCILPLGIVLIIFGTKAYCNKKQSEILIKAIDNGIDTDKLLESLANPKKTPLEILNKRLQRGCVYSMLGVACLILGIIINYSKILPMTAVDERLVFTMIFIVFGGIFMAIGISFLITWASTRKQVKNIQKNK